MTFSKDTQASPPKPRAAVTKRRSRAAQHNAAHQTRGKRAHTTNPITMMIKRNALTGVIESGRKARTASKDKATALPWGGRQDFLAKWPTEPVMRLTDLFLGSAVALSFARSPRLPAALDHTGERVSFDHSS